MRFSLRFAASVVLAAVAGGAIAISRAQDPAPDGLPPGAVASLDRISADSLRGHLSFLASDLLEGRDTPSRGLDIAAEYIAAQFRRVGLEPIGDDGYFQTATWKVSEPDAASFDLEMEINGKTTRVSKEGVTFRADGPFDLQKLKLVQLNFDEFAAGKISADDVQGRAIVLVPKEGQDVNPRTIATRSRALKPALTLVVDRDPSSARGLVGGRLIDPESPRGGNLLRGLGGASAPTITLHDPRALSLLNEIAVADEASVSLKMGPPVEREVKLRNVAGLLRGSDPVLKGTYVLVTAHYDHVGIGAPVMGDAIYNGANDDGSGTVSVIELASALSTLAEKPKRSLVFMTVWGEEHGLLGSRYYGRHPLVPVEKTVADVNLEQVGRTDSAEGPQVAAASMTGYDFSTMGEIFRKASEAEGVKVFKHPRNSDGYFGASDNQALADLGVPAHTLCVAYQYPDYHGAADHWEKIDYANMAKIDRVVGRALLTIANSADAPRWNAENPKARRYLKAYEEHHAEAGKGKTP